MRSEMRVACILLAAAQAMSLPANAANSGLPECSPVPKMHSVGEQYPPIIERMPEGTVTVEVTIELSGRVSAVRVLDSSEPKLTKAAGDAAAKWVFEAPRFVCRHRVPIQFRTQRV
jgi:TonB family protein